MSHRGDEDSRQPASRPNPIDVHVGRQIRQRRATLGISLEQLASTLGISFQQVQKYERGVNRVSSSRLHDLTVALRVPVSYFFEDAPVGRAGSVDWPSGIGQSVDSFDDYILNRRETFDLVRAYTRISDAGMRRHVLGLIRSLAPGPTH